MNSRFLPKTIDNQYRGNKLALWFLWVVIIIRGLQGIALILQGPAIVKDADGIPLESFPAAASQSIVAVFVVSGLSRLVLSLLGVLILVRYKSAVSLMFAVLVFDQLGKELVLQIYPLFRVGSPIGPTVNLTILVLTFLGLVLSLTGKRIELDKA